MTAEQDLSGFRCYCAHCMGQNELAQSDGPAESWNRSYYVPDPPKIPPPPGSSGTTAPPPEPGYTGPRFYTLLRGDDWNDPQVGVPAVVPYTFATRAMSNYSTGEDDVALPGFAGTSGQPLNEAQRAGVRQALDSWAQVSGLTFVEVSDTTQLDFGGIRFLMEAQNAQDLLGSTTSSGDPYGFNIVFNRAAYGGSALEPGSDGYWTALHEIGHAVGLKHPFEGDPVLRASENTNRNTVMSYTDAIDVTGLGPFDVDAVRHLYGLAEAKATAPVRWFQGPGGSLLILADDQDNFVLGSVARDVVRAGGGDDYIRLDAGNDWVRAGAGNDAVFGNDGDDVLSTGKLRDQAAVTVSYVDEGEEITGTVLMADDELDTFYGVETLDFVDYSTAMDPRGAGGKLWRLYDAAFDRPADAMGFGYWMDALRDGTTTLPKIAATFAASREFASLYGGTNTYEFVLALYENVLGREPNEDEGPDVGYWMDVVRIAGRGVALLDFSEAEEHFEALEETPLRFGNGRTYANADAVDVLRAYMTVLDRRPDADGLISWTEAREAGLSQAELIGHLASSPEFQARFGALSNQGFVEQLYRTSLDRAPDAGGLAAWTRVLDAGIESRASVALGFSNSPEMTSKAAFYVNLYDMYV